MCVIVIKLHDDQSEGLNRRAIIQMVVTASGGKLTTEQAARTWDKTIFPFGQKNKLLTGYVKAQDGTSKRTAAGNAKLQRDWHVVITELFDRIRAHNKEVLRDDRLVEVMMDDCVCNLDEECLHALGKNSKVAGSASKTKHDNQHATSRFHFFCLF